MNQVCEYCGTHVKSEETYTFFVPPLMNHFDCLCRGCAIEWSRRADEMRTLGTVQSNALLKIAQEVTDEVMGQGSYAKANGAPPLTIQEEPDGFDM